MEKLDSSTIGDIFPTNVYEKSVYR